MNLPIAKIPTVGRPRIVRTHTVICDAVLELVGGGATLSSLSLVGIARHTGISRNSLYRRWQSKGQLYSDVVTSMRRDLPELTEQSARENLIALFEMIDIADARSNGRMEQAIVSEAANFPHLHEQYLLEIVAPFRRAVKVAIRRGKETREIRADVDEDLLADVLVTSAKDRGDQEADATSRRIIDLVFDGVSPQ